MVVIFQPDGRLSKTGDILLPADTAHKVLEPGPDLEAVEVAEKARMMQADPPSPALFYILLKGVHRRGFPTVRNVVQLKDQLVAGKEFLVDGIGGRCVSDPEIGVDRQVVEPGPGTARECEMMAAVLIEREDPETGNIDLLVEAVHHRGHGSVETAEKLVVLWGPGMAETVVPAAVFDLGIDRKSVV